VITSRSSRCKRQHGEDIYDDVRRTLSSGILPREDMRVNVCLPAVRLLPMKHAVSLRERADGQGQVNSTNTLTNTHEAPKVGHIKPPVWALLIYSKNALSVK
jgi:hypothetical protein